MSAMRVCRYNKNSTIYAPVVGIFSTSAPHGDKNTEPLGLPEWLLLLLPQQTAAKDTHQCNMRFKANSTLVSTTQNEVGPTEIKG